jgi:hypothetical protein
MLVCRGRWIHRPALGSRSLDPPLLISFVRLFGIGALVVVSTGCQTPAGPRASLVDTVPSTAGSILKTIDDPTGSKQRNKDISEAADAFTNQVEELDVEALNTAVNDLAALLRALNLRADAWPPELPTTVIEEIRAAQLEARSADLQKLIVQATDTLSEVDVAAMESILLQIQQEVTGLAERLEERIDTIDIARINEIIARSAGLEQKYIAVMEQTVRTEQSIDKVIADLPLAQVRATADELQRTAASASSLIHGLRITMWLTNALLGILALCGIVWMVRRSKS